VDVRSRRLARMLARHSSAAALETARAKRAGLLKQIARLDRPACGDAGNHLTRFWPAVLDRWLY